MIEVCIVAVTKAFGWMLAAVFGVYAAGTVMSEKNSKNDPIGDKLRAMTGEVAILNRRLDALTNNGGQRNDGTSF